MRLEALARGQQLRLAAHRTRSVRMVSAARPASGRHAQKVTAQARQSAALRELQLQQEERQQQAQESRIPTGAPSPHSKSLTCLSVNLAAVK
jgi:hypothetical protein